MRIKQTKRTTKFYTSDKKQVKKLLFELGIVSTPEYTYKRRPHEKPYSAVYELHYKLNKSEITYIKTNFKKENLLNTIITGFKGNLITSFTWIYEKGK